MVMEWLRARKWSSLGRSTGFVMLIAGLLVSVLFGVLAFSYPARAEEGAEWKDGDIIYNGATFKRYSDASMIKAMGLGENDFVYSNGGFSSAGDVGIIHFTSDGDIRNLTSIKYTVYTFTPPSIFMRKSETDVAIKPIAADGGAATSCNIGGGFGWIICPLSGNIASAIDWLFGMLKSFLVVPPLETGNRTSGLFLAWDIVRNIANMVFIVMFIVIIYSQITSAGISNYGIKKMLPRLIIDALAVNLSYIVCAVLLDISNIAGSALQDMFMSVRDTVATLGTAQDAGNITWEDITGAIISGSAITAGGIISGFTFGAELIFFLGPLLVGIGLILLLVVLILAARQALIVILIILSPLAFVCNLLPGTEKWFEKWKETFLAMLIFFPGFAAAFGGAQLAGMVIIQSAKGSNGAVMLLLGMAVQVAPLAITPLLIKLSGGVLGKFAGILNDRKKGLFDRSMNWARDRSTIKKGERFRKNAERAEEHGWRNMTPLGMRRRLDAASRSRKMRAEAWRKEGMDALALQSRSGLKADKYRRELEQMQQRLGNKAETAWNEHQLSDNAATLRDIAARAAADEAAGYKAMVNNRYTAIKTGTTDYMAELHANMAANETDKKKLQKQLAELNTIGQHARNAAENVAIEALYEASAKRVEQHVFATALGSDPSLRERAGQLEDMYFGDNLGSERARATAQAAIKKAREEGIENASTIWASLNASSDEKSQAAAIGKSVRGVVMTDGLRISAIRDTVGGKEGANGLYSTFENVDFGNLSAEMAEEFGQALSGSSNKPFWLGKSVAAQIKEGKAPKRSGAENMRRWFIEAFNGDKGTSAEVMVTQDKVYIEKMRDLIYDNGIRSKLDDDSIQATLKEIKDAFTKSQFSGRIGERRKALQEIYKTLGGTDEPWNT